MVISTTMSAVFRARRYGATTRGHNSPQVATCSTGEDRNRSQSELSEVSLSASHRSTRPPAIYVEEGQRSERSITLVQLMPRSASRSGLAAPKVVFSVLKSSDAGALWTAGIGDAARCNDSWPPP